MKSTLLVSILLWATSVFAQPDSLHVLWDRSGATDSSAYGYAILPLGDQNGDGFADWAVYAQGNFGIYHGTRSSYLEFFHGGNPPSTEPYFVFRQDSPAFYQEWFADVIGDINGDGYQDWMTAYWPQGFPPYRIYGFFYGGHEITRTPDFQWTVPVVFGFHSLSGFDFNGDGVDDLFGENYETGEAYIYYGGNPLDTIPDWTLHSPPVGINQLYPAAIGDFNGDGASDFICHNPNPPYNTAIFLGGANPDTIPAYFWSNVGVVGGINSVNDDSTDDWVGADGTGLGVFFGRSVLRPGVDAFVHSEAAHAVASAGDLNHDGYGDFILYSPGCLDNMFGCLDIHLGGSWLNPDPVITVEGWSEPMNLIGIYTAAGLGDVNGDGVDDIAIGAYNDFAYLGWRGRCIIIAGDTALHVSADEPRAEIPQSLQVTAYPNPFNGETTIRFEAPQNIRIISLTTYNLLGQIVAHSEIPCFPGLQEYRYDASSYSSGLYLLHVEAGTVQTTQKLMLLR